MTTIALPNPQSVTLGRIPEVVLQSRDLRVEIEGNGDGDAALELLSRLEALQAYLADKEAASTIAGEARLTEVLIGKLLGPAEIGRPAQAEGEGSKLEPFAEIPKVERNRFRALAEHETEVKKLVAEGVVKRAALLRAINGYQEPDYEACPTCGRPMRADKPARGKG